MGNQYTYYIHNSTVMNDIVYYFLQKYDSIDRLMLSYVNKHTYNLFKKLNSPLNIDYMANAVQYNYINIIKLLLNYNYLSNNSIHLAILNSHFDILKLFEQYKHINYDTDDIQINAIKSNNIKMFRYIKNRTQCDYTLNHKVILALVD